MNKYILLFSTATIIAIFLSACTDDSSSGSSPTESPIESSSTLPPTDFNNISSSEINPENNPNLSPTSSATLPEVVATEITYDEFGFVDIQPVFQSIKANEKAIFIMRHAERQPQITRESKLTEDGIEQAISVGQKLISSEELYYISTDFVRTKMTCEKIAEGRGQATFPYDTSGIFTSSTFIQDTAKFTEYNNAPNGSNKMTITKWAYNGEFADAFYNIAETCEKVVTDAFAIAKGRINIICSHDEFLTPLIVYFSDKKADLRIFETGKNRHWLNFLAGIAIIIDDQGNRRIYPIKGLADAHE